MTNPPPSASIEVLGRGGKLVTVIGTVLLLFFGGIAIYGTFHQADLSGVERVIGGVIGVGFGGMGLLFLVDLPPVLGRHTIVVDFEAIAYEVTLSYVKSFRVPWTELAGVNVSMAERDDRMNRSVLVRLDLTPVDAQAFAARYPKLGKLRRDRSWRLFLGPNPGVIKPLAAALDTYSGGRYRGIEDDGLATGWTYR